MCIYALMGGEDGCDGRKWRAEVKWEGGLVVVEQRWMQGVSICYEVHPLHLPNWASCFSFFSFTNRASEGFRNNLSGADSFPWQCSNNNHINVWGWVFG